MLICSVCVMGRGVEEKKRKEDLEKKDREIAELTASASENEGEGAKVPFFLPRKHSVKNYYTDSDSLVCSKTRTHSGRFREERKSFRTEEEKQSSSENDSSNKQEKKKHYPTHTMIQ